MPINKRRQFVQTCSTHSERQIETPISNATFAMPLLLIGRFVLSQGDNSPLKGGGELARTRVRLHHPHQHMPLAAGR